tara:strand:+ start:201 stop:665 length:465 start_codon:yes stop_codon:yes gene_type:complete
MHEDYELLLKMTPEEMAVRILDKRRLLSDQISFIKQGLEESVDELQEKHDKILVKYNVSKKNGINPEKTSKIKDEWDSLREELKEMKTQLKAAIRINDESAKAISYWARRVNEGTEELDYDNPDLLRYAKDVRSGKISREGKRSKQKGKGGGKK